MALSAAVHHSFDKVAAELRPTGTEDGQDRGCERRSTETEV